MALAGVALSIGLALGGLYVVLRRKRKSAPVAGALVDRWDQKQVLVVSDILRAAAVLAGAVLDGGPDDRRPVLLVRSEGNETDAERLSA